MTQYEIGLAAKQKELQEQNRELTSNHIFDYCIEQLPDDIKSNPWAHINHGIGVLKTEEELNAYIAAYSNMHQIKCLTAFQQLDFEDLNSYFEIVDWGCGQGIGSMVLLELLKEHEKAFLARKITLIEPSCPALQRAIVNVLAINPNLDFVAVNKYLPGRNEDYVQEINYCCKKVIHIFSNILDIQDIDLTALAKVVADSSRKHYIMCMGPMNSGYLRIKQFADIFPHSKVISQLENPRFSYTKDKKHVFGCYTNCFEYNGEDLNLNNSTEVQPVLVDGKLVYDDYDDNAMIANGILSDKEFYLYEKLKGELNNDDYIFVKPRISGDTPLFVIVRPNIGVILVTKHTCNNSCRSTIEIINQYYKNLFQLHVKDLYAKALSEKSYWNIVKKVVYLEDCSYEDFINGLKKEKPIKEECKDFNKEHLKFTYLLDNNALKNKDSQRLLHDMKMDEPKTIFKSMLCKNFVRAISGNWHSYKSGIIVPLNRAQVKLSESHPAIQKISGGAGSGKTQVLAERAVNAQLRTGGDVLILSYNITLTNYLEMRLDAVRKNFPWDKFVFMNYHEFFNCQARNLCCPIHNLEPYDSLDFFKGKKTHKFSAIFVDEVQDYRPEWLTILKNYFLADNGEFVVFGDSKQNVYNRELDQNGDIKLGALIGGLWNKSLKTVYRFHKDIVKLLNAYQRNYYEDPELLESESQLDIFEEKHLYCKTVSKTTTAEQLYELCMSIMNDYAYEHNGEDIRSSFTMLSQSVDVLRDINTLYCNEHGSGKTMITFETQDQYDKLKTSSGIPFEQALDEVRKNKKRHFKCGSKLIKLSTIQSFKGWESQNVILILQPEGFKAENLHYCVSKKEDNTELIYTGITRAKDKLFIINMENQKYGEFFRTHCLEI